MIRITDNPRQCFISHWAEIEFFTVKDHEGIYTKKDPRQIFSKPSALNQNERDTFSKSLLLSTTDFSNVKMKTTPKIVNQFKSKAQSIRVKKSP